MEILGKHDDMVIALGLAVQATKEYRESIVILDGPTWQKRLGWSEAQRIYETQRSCRNLYGIRK